MNAEKRAPSDSDRRSGASRAKILKYNASDINTIVNPGKSLYGIFEKKALPFRY
jgi:hypothetical protein